MPSPETYKPNSELLTAHHEVLERLRKFGYEPGSAATFAFDALEMTGRFHILAPTKELGIGQMVLAAKGLMRVGLLTSTDTPLGRHSYVQATPELPKFAAKHNLFIWHLIHEIIKEDGHDIARRDILRTALGGFAAMNTPPFTVEAEPTLPLNDIICSIAEQAKMHPENIVHRALGMFAVRANVATRLKNRRSALIRARPAK